jgi:hypothetical protein
MRRALVVLSSLVAGTGCSGLDGSVATVMPFPIVDGPIEAIAVTPLALVPAFSPTIFDYYVRCTASTNDLVVTVSGSGHTAAQDYSLVANDAVEIGEYFIRCLPPDFPVIGVTTHPDLGAPTPGYFLVDSGPYVAVLDLHGTPVWYEPTTSGGNVDSLAPDTISYLPNAEYPYGIDAVPSFQLVDLAAGTATTLTSPDAPTNEHELQLLPNGDYLMFADQITPHVDLAEIDYGADASVADCKIEELDPAGNLVWSWLGSDHIDANDESVTATTNLIGGVTVVDPYHCNSIEIGPDGDLLVSARHTSALYDIDRATGTIRWKLGGTAASKDGAAHLDVVDDPYGGFNLQHDARFLANGDITLFDDHGLYGGSDRGVARGIELALDHDAGTARIVWEARGRSESQYMGSFRRYPDGHSVLGWGYIPGDPQILTEVDAQANDVLDISFELDVTFAALTYRAIKVPTTQLDHALLRAMTAR